MNFRSVTAHLMNLVFPAKCASCGDYLPSGEVCLCEECDRKLPVIRGEICLHCGREPARCTCGKRRMAFSRCVAPYYYGGGNAEYIIKEMKFHRHPEYAAFFAAKMVDVIHEHYADIPFDLVVAVPMWQGKARVRGYNQSALLAKSIGAALGCEFIDGAAEQIAENNIQHSLSRADRWRNVEGIYRVPPDKTIRQTLRGKTILLADDILTTGATMDSCARALISGGAKRVYAVTAAVTLRGEMLEGVDISR